MSRFLIKNLNNFTSSWHTKLLSGITSKFQIVPTDVPKRNHTEILPHTARRGSYLALLNKVLKVKFCAHLYKYLTYLFHLITKTYLRLYLFLRFTLRGLHVQVSVITQKAFSPTLRSLSPWRRYDVLSNFTDTFNAKGKYLTTKSNLQNRGKEQQNY